MPLSDDLARCAAVPRTPSALARGRRWPARSSTRGGSDDRGVVYALTEAADIVASSPDPIAGLLSTSRRAQPAATPVRSVMRMFSSDIEDKGWFNDRDFWRDYLSMLATERFNRFNLAFGLGYDFATGLKDTYFYFAYPFLLAVPGYNVRATNLPDAERDRNLEMLRFISDETVARGLEFQLGIWTHAYVWQNSPDVNHVIEGLTADRHAVYSRDALALLLKSCPNISGVTLRIHGESGVAEGSYDFWKTVFDGAVRSGPKGAPRPPRQGHRPADDRQWPSRPDCPITVSPKFWAEHMGLPYHPGGHPSDGVAGARTRRHRADGAQHRRSQLHTVRIRGPAHRRSQVLGPASHLARNPAGVAVGRSDVRGRVRAEA